MLNYKIFSWIVCAAKINEFFTSLEKFFPYYELAASSAFGSSLGSKSSNEIFSINNKSSLAEWYAYEDPSIFHVLGKVLPILVS